MASGKLKRSEKEKISTAARRIVAKTYGFKQSSYCNWTVKEGYIFIIYDLGRVSLRVKPLYFDDILWEMLGVEEKLPMSLRATGIDQVHSLKIAEYKLPMIEDSNYTVANLEKVWQEIFKYMTGKIELFLAENPDVEKYEVDQQDRYDIAPLMVLWRHGQYEEALTHIKERMARGETGLVWTHNLTDMTEYSQFDKIKEYCESKVAELKR